MTLRPLLFALGSLLFAICAQAQPQPSAVVNRYCVTCHNQRLKTAKLELDRLDLAHPEKDALTWERAIRKLRGGMMPPPGAHALGRRGEFARDLPGDLAGQGRRCESESRQRPDSPAESRRVRERHARPVRHRGGRATLLPTDDISDGFDNIASALKVSPSFLDQYIMAARAVAKQAIGTPVPEGDEDDAARHGRERASSSRSAERHHGHLPVPV